MAARSAALRFACGLHRLCSNLSCTLQQQLIACPQLHDAQYWVACHRMEAYAISQSQLRHYSANESDYSKEVDEINTLFAEARDEIDYAKEEAETVYFNESVVEAKKAVDSVLDKWQALLSRLSEPEKAKLQRAMGLKMEQLKAEYQQVASLHS